MGLLSGVYDAKTGGGFQAGGMSLHNIMAGHGPDADAHERVSPFSTTYLTVGLQYGIETSEDHGGQYGIHVWYTSRSPRMLTFILESSLMLGVSEWALKQAHVQEMYSEHSWGNLKRHFPENYKKLNNLSNEDQWKLKTVD
jgi:homogentisate 1,2-dioxygenase